MASQGQTTRDVARFIADKKLIKGVNPIATICSGVDANSQQGKKQVIAAVERLRSQGLVEIVREKGKIIEIKPRQAPATTERWRPETAEGLRQARFARGYPSTLPDSMCGPVVTTRITSQGDQSEPVSDGQEEVMEPRSETQPPVGFAYSIDMEYDDVLTMCLEALRQAADENGKSTNGVRNVLSLIDGFDGNQIARATQYLRVMGLYSAKMTGFQTSTYVVDTKTERVTAEMVSEARPKITSSSSQKSGKGKRGRKTTRQTAVRTAPQSSDQPSGGNPLERLVAIIERLEREKADLAAVLHTTRVELGTLRSENAELKKAAAPPEVSKRVAGILNRYS